MYAADPYSAAHGADALCVMTEWLVYRNPDFERVRKLLRRPLLWTAAICTIPSG